MWAGGGDRAPCDQAAVEHVGQLAPSGPIHAWKSKEPPVVWACACRERDDLASRNEDMHRALGALQAEREELASKVGRRWAEGRAGLRCGLQGAMAPGSEWGAVASRR